MLVSGIMDLGMVIYLDHFKGKEVIMSLVLVVMVLLAEMVALTMGKV